MTAKPWPHEWRAGFRLLPVPDMEHEPMPALLVYEVGLPHQLSKQGKLYGIDIEESPGKHWHVDSNDPRVQPDLDDGPTKGALLEMVREGWSDPDAHVMTSPGVQWEVYVHVPANGYDEQVFTGATEGKALKAALDHLARWAKLNEVEGIPLTILLQSSIPMASSLTKPATFHDGGFVGSDPSKQAVADELNTTLAAASGPVYWEDLTEDEQEALDVPKR